MIKEKMIIDIEQHSPTWFHQLYGLHVAITARRRDRAGRTETRLSGRQACLSGAQAQALGIIVLAALAMLWPARANATLSVIQTPIQTCAASPCSMTITSTGSGHLLAVIGTASTASSTITAISCTSSCGTWTHCTLCEASDATAGSADAEYILSSTSGATSVSITMTGVNDIWLYEVSTTGSVSLDTQGTRDQSTSTTTSAGVALTLTGSNDIVIQSAVCNTTINAIGGGYTAKFQNGNGSAYLLNTASGTAPTWTQTSGRNALNAIAFKEAASTTRPPTGLSMGVGD